MANQPKKYKKFVASAATATLVASAIVPVASAATPSDIAGNDHEQNIKDLLELGYVSGKADGTFAPNEAVTRGQVVLMLGKWAEAQGIEVPADYLEKEYFTDYPSYLTDDNKKYYALVKAAGIFEGYEDGSLKPAQNLSRVQLAVVLNSAYEAVTGKSLVDLAGDTSDVVLGDIDAIYAPYQPAVLAMKKLGITAPANFNPTGTVTRGQFASFLNATIKAEAPAGEAATAIQSLTATGKSQLTVQFNGSVDTEAAKFALAQSSTAIAVSDVDWNEEKTEAVLTVDGTFSDATYTLTVSGVTEQDLTATVTTTREKVTTIEFLSDKLVLTGRENTPVAGGEEYKEAIITFAIYNQYGEDITESVNESYLKDLDVNGIDVYEDANQTYVKAPYVEDGKFVVWVDGDEDDDATGSVEFTYERNDEEINVKHDVQLSDEGEPAQVEIVGLYSPNDDELNVENLEDRNAEFSILFKVKDQYGIEMDAEFADDTNSNASSGDTTMLEQVREGLSVDVSDDDIFEIEDADDNGSGHGLDGVEVINVDGEYYFAIDIFADDITDVKSGDNTVTFRSQATGEETSQVFTVADSGEPHSIELGLPNEVIAGDEDVLLPVFAYDASGELITNAKSLNDDLSEDKILVKPDNGLVKNATGNQATDFTFVEKNGQVYLKFKSSDNLRDEAEEFDIEIEVDKSGVENTLTLFVEPNAHPEKIVKIADNALTYIASGDTTTIKFEDIVFEDQYGRIYDDYSNDAANHNAAPADSNRSWEKYKVRARVLNNNIIASGDSTEVVNGTTYQTINNNSDGKFTFTANGGNATVEFSLVGEDVQDNPILDTLDVTFRTVEFEDFKSYVVKSDGVVDAIDTSDDAGITVYGVLGNGLEIELTNPNSYQIIPGKYLTGDSSTGITASGSYNNVLTDEGDKVETEVTVIINEDGTSITHALTLVNEEPKVSARFAVVDKDSLGNSLLEDITVDYSTVNSNDGALKLDEIINEILSEGKFDVEDQFDQDVLKTYDANGNDLNSNSGPRNINVTNGEVTFANGTDTEKVVFTISDINSNNDKGVVTGNASQNLSVDLGSDGLESGDSFTLTLSIDGKSQAIKVFLQ
ncbi:hypothetical protein CD30_13860 [Ureibacillus massiliensis 4400831 = CIP 108448 = CCUG 49529]|uniref:SLH domain-containing protein n=1 Tax=Ureibacillus massiliensis 4400831 = CIP 108448 = CCUG 49529 TaxID=1211035 RepID=A0A0A3J2V0_9BACL|nr:S-layer homology domain-containing protein [Ureibacillus massiliensis]KGR90055.1 hypothetical protein CD30_13860 [Ureibacillus massiliensis 4400831 = CIP 108448 = CCUG 49529]